MHLLFLMSLVAQAGSAAPKSTPELMEKGKQAFAVNCVSCHGELGDGKGPAGEAVKARNFTQDKFKAGTKPEQVFKTIANGLPGTSMAGFGHLPEEDRWGLVYYVLHFRKKK